MSWRQILTGIWREHKVYFTVMPLWGAGAAYNNRWDNQLVMETVPMMLFTGLGYAFHPWLPLSQTAAYWEMRLRGRDPKEHEWVFWTPGCRLNPSDRFK